MSKVRDECIALEAVSMAIRANAQVTGKTFGQIADEAIAKVDEWEQRGELAVLHYSWTHDPDERENRA